MIYYYFRTNIYTLATPTQRYDSVEIFLNVCADPVSIPVPLPITGTLDSLSISGIFVEMLILYLWACFWHSPNLKSKHNYVKYPFIAI